MFIKSNLPAFYDYQPVESVENDEVSDWDWDRDRESYEDENEDDIDN